MKATLSTLITLIVFFFVVSTPALSQDEPLVNAQFNSGLEAYESGRYSQCISILGELLDNLKLTSIERIIKAHSVLGASHFLLGNRQKSQSHFEALLNFDSNSELSDIYFSPEVIAFFNELKGVDTTKPAGSNNSVANTDVKQKQNVPEAKGIFQEDGDPDTKNPYMNNFIPFGFAQFKNNQIGKGTFFLTSESISLATLLATAIAYKIKQKSDGSFDDPSVERGLKSAFYTSLTLYLFLTATGIADALLSYREYPYRDKSLVPSVSLGIDGRNAYSFLVGIEGF